MNREYSKGMATIKDMVGFLMNSARDQEDVETRKNTAIVERIEIDCTIPPWIEEDYG